MQAIALPTDFSAKLARNTQLILAEETGVRRVADPLGGSFYLEALTTQARRSARRCRGSHLQSAQDLCCLGLSTLSALTPRRCSTQLIHMPLSPCPFLHPHIPRSGLADGGAG